MIAVVQRVSEARVVVDGRTVGEIANGLVVLAAVERDDTDADIEWTAGKLAALRIFRNGDKHFDLDVKQVGGAILLVSNFTVAAETRKGRRPSLDGAASPEQGRRMFDQLVEAVRRFGIAVAIGEFGADMGVSLVNDGPATFLVKSRDGSVTPPPSSPPPSPS
jgi:D-tyrosyl-tRNA(Tyr) deacylase